MVGDLCGLGGVVVYLDGVFGKCIFGGVEVGFDDVFFGGSFYDREIGEWGVVEILG